MTCEMRSYEVVPGRMPALNAGFNDHTIGFFQRYGIGEGRSHRGADPERDLAAVAVLGDTVRRLRSWRPGSPRS